MTGPDSTTVMRVFAEVVDLSPDERSRVIDRHLPATDEHRRAAVARLLAAHDQADRAQFMAAPPVPTENNAAGELFANTDEPARGHQIGPYRVIDTLGEGGMGVVYLAKQVEPIQRRVALKVVRLGMESKRIVARFEAERRLLSMLDHRYIARFIDAGQTKNVFGDGRPYFVMEYVPGEPLTAFADANRLTLRERVRLIEQTCRAVDHAHQRSVVHRDLKPSNVLVVRDDDGRPAPKIIDFGIARAVGLDDEPDAGLTRPGERPGTPAYFSPEQASGGGDQVDHRVDVYAMGVVLYELVAGVLPFVDRADDADEAAIAAIKKHDAPPASVRFGELGGYLQQSIAQRRDCDVQTLRRMLGGAIGGIAQRALRRNPDERYQSAAELADELALWLGEEPPDRAAQPFRRFVQDLGLRFENRRGGLWLAAAGAGVVFVGAGGWITFGLAGVAGAGVLALTAITARSAWRLAEGLATARQRGRTADRARREALAARAEAERQRDDARQRAYAATLAAADAALRDRAYAVARRRLADAPESLRRWEWFYLLSPLEDRSSAVLTGHESWVIDVAVREDDGLIASGSRDGTVRLWRGATHRPTAVLRGHRDVVHAVDFSACGRMLASASWDRTVRLWSIDAEGRGRPEAELTGHAGWIACMAYSPGGRWLVSGDHTGEVLLWDAAEGTCVSRSRAHDGVVYCCAWPSDGGRLATGGADRMIRVWRVGEGGVLRLERELAGHEDWVRAVAFSPDSNALASAGADGLVRLWDPADGRVLADGREHRDRVYALAWRADGAMLASGGSDATIVMWEPMSMRVRDTLLGHESRVFSLAFEPGGQRVYSASEDATLRCWQITAERHDAVLADHPGAVFGVAMTPDGRFLACATGDRAVDLWQAETEAQLAAPTDPDAATIALWDVEQRVRVALLTSHTDKVSAVAISPDGSRLASASYDRTVQVWNLKAALRSDAGTDADGPSLLLEGHTAWVFSAAFSPDSRRIVTGAGDRTVRVWDADSGTCVATWRGHRDRVNTVACSPDGRFVASGSSDRTVRLWEHETGRCLALLADHGGWVLRWRSARTLGGWRRAAATT